MEPKELDEALADLETRLERLRSLYEQYFLGIEKIEPTIARKDVDRRFWILRRTKLRNTARRFRMSLLVARYNTFQQYWVRICRQIDNGTYIRHLRKAEAAFGKEALTISGQRRKKRREREDAAASSRSGAGVGRNEEPAIETSVVTTSDFPLRSDFPELDVRQSDFPLRSSFPPQSDPPRVDEDLSTKQTTAFRAVRPAEARSETPTPVAPAPDQPPPSSTTALHTRPTTRLPAIPAKSSGESIGRHLPKVTLSPQRTAARTPAEPPATTNSGSAVTGQRIKELHDQLSAEKKRLSDDTPISLDGLSKSLNEAASKLRAIHGSNKRIDFRVVVKGGKAMVKPILKT